MTNYEIWDALAAAKHHILCVAEPEPEVDAEWNALSERHFGVSLLSHQEVAIRQLNALAERLDADGHDADMRAGVQALRFLVESDRAQGAYWLIDRVASRVYLDVAHDPRPMAQGVRP